MITATATIVNKLGLHARPSAMLVTTASRFESEVWVTKDGLRVNGKSIMGVMMLAAERGSQLLIEVNGPDEQEALQAVLRVIEGGFGERPD
ncbi:MAG TPA: HPr family phosphocarrier protein [candidate division Zixibacteria bacterium]|nr:HPr family phosphocarrier protein [candidate division Zixibacteria bacterium]MDD4917397.1 HPr family phosphocarrier protein [candidate division Zixibacteria bacterium]MDM7972395.1 HPr family phosphocarrier protein [candidate division Zixibacteria bacterium]HOD66199.1 HPr family phosphocarrier protein [candidate division Zixibacteria bacterium]HOZ07308.1 HPr family phosphocarrier protein [candidate division Zixibacteria bacterium]